MNYIMVLVSVVEILTELIAVNCVHEADAASIFTVPINIHGIASYIYI